MISPVELNANVLISSKCSFFRKKNLDENFCTVYKRILGARQPIIWQNVCQKLHENERIWTGASLAPSFDAPLMMAGIFWRPRTKFLYSFQQKKKGKEEKNWKGNAEKKRRWY